MHEENRRMALEKYRRREEETKKNYTHRHHQKRMNKQFRNWLILQGGVYPHRAASLFWFLFNVSLLDVKIRFVHMLIIFKSKTNKTITLIKFLRSFSMSMFRLFWFQVIQRRDDFGEPRENFNRDWSDYKNGFGDPAKEFWLGNENIYMLTNNEDYSLRVELEDFEGNKRYVKYTCYTQLMSNIHVLHVHLFFLFLCLTIIVMLSIHTLKSIRRPITINSKLMDTKVMLAIHWTIHGMAQTIAHSQHIIATTIEVHWIVPACSRYEHSFRPFLYCQHFSNIHSNQRWFDENWLISNCSCF